jgi:hypothetical protein
MRIREFPPWPQRIFWLLLLFSSVGFGIWLTNTSDRVQDLLIVLLCAAFEVALYSVMVLLYRYYDSKGRLSADG